MLKPATAAIQSKVAAFCRSGKYTDIPGIQPDRLKEYRRLIVNIFNDTLQQAYPIAYRFLAEEAWNDMLLTFIKDHNCQTNYIWKLPFEFYEFVRDNNFQEKYEHPFLNELLYFEWKEIEMHTMPDISATFCRDGNLMNDRIVVNPEHEIIRLTYPVHLYPVQEAAKHPGNYFVLIYRVPESGNVNFLNISILHTYLIEQLNHEKIFLKELLIMISDTFQIPCDADLQAHILQFLKELQACNMVLGFTNQ